MIAAFSFFKRISIMTAWAKFKPVQSPRWTLVSSALPNVNMKQYKSVTILSNFQNQVPLRKYKSPIQDFLATVLVFKPHIFSRDSLVAFDSYQSEKVRVWHTRIVNLTITTIWVRFTWRVLLVSWDFYSRGKRVATWSSRCALKSSCRHTCYIGAGCLFF